MEPYNKKLGTDTWFYAKRCFLSLIENLAKQMIIVRDSVLNECLQFLEQCERNFIEIWRIILKSTNFHVLSFRKTCETDARWTVGGCIGRRTKYRNIWGQIFESANASCVTWIKDLIFSLNINLVKMNNIVKHLIMFPCCHKRFSKTSIINLYSELRWHQLAKFLYDY